MQLIIKLFLSLLSRTRISNIVDLSKIANAYYKNYFIKIFPNYINLH